ncbi:hypothetical protein [Parendozoicomonas haliclonae]|uniref:Uncharacterized protein n=1 Tax=Parendozoicomonas haliclonae TaxID=1960125 RepID=A0A1X7AL52_9GAMM|nr:hypothetical protein [Parendozoicomonas haliclonae]SMA48591.1 hypothetical protein EHSB41UT_02796 [Parendozoicomonas haliclonae]
MSKPYQTAFQALVLSGAISALCLTSFVNAESLEDAPDEGPSLGTIFDDFAESVSYGANYAYEEAGNRFVYGENPHAKEEAIVVSEEALVPFEAALCYIGHWHTANELRNREDMKFLGHRIAHVESGLGKPLIMLADGDMQSLGLEVTGNAGSNSQQFRQSDGDAQKIGSWCFGYTSYKQDGIFDQLKALGWLNDSRRITWIEDGDKVFRHSGSGLVIASHPEGHRKAAQWVESAELAAKETIYLLDKKGSIGRISPSDLGNYAEKGLGTLELVDPTTIQADYYYKVFSMMRYASMKGFLATAALGTAAAYTFSVGATGALAVGGVVGLAAPVVAPYVLPEQALQDLGPIELPLATIQALAGLGAQGLGKAAQLTGKVLSGIGHSITPANEQQISFASSYVGAAILFGTPLVLKGLNFVTVGYAGAAIKLLVGGGVFATGAMGAWALRNNINLLTVTDWSMIGKIGVIANVLSQGSQQTTNSNR